MANVNIKFNNKDYLLSCDDGQEENLKQLADHLSAKYNDLKKSLGNIGESKLLLISSIKIVDDYFDLFKKVKHNKNDFEKLSIKFKELRSLAINYKEEKEESEKNFKNLLKQHQELKSELEKINKDVVSGFGSKNNINQKIDELNQETETLIDEIEKWQT